jgi:hypothetical protein
MDFYRILLNRSGFLRKDKMKSFDFFSWLSKFVLVIWGLGAVGGIKTKQSM